MELYLDLFLKNVDAHPEQPAITDDNGALTYRELLDLSLRVAEMLAEAGVKKGDIVAIELPRVKEYAAAMLGSWLAGAGFTPLDAAYPQARLSYIKADCSAKLVLTREMLENAATRSPLAAPVFPEPSDVALIIYTSGSTGKPKGVVHDQESILNSVRRQLSFIQLEKGDRYGMSSVFTFIAIVLEVFMPLYAGAHIQMIPDSVRKDVRLLSDYLYAHQITHAFISPKMLRQFSSKGGALRTVITGSERISDVFSNDYSIISLYGMSESCLGATAFIVDKAYDNTPIGKPMEGVTVYLLDDENRPADEGEICLAGHFSSGYLNLPELTSKTFTANPYAAQDGSPILLRTGDLARRLSDGNLIYLNRKDWMVKINGQRVEPSEIESALRTLPDILDAAVKGFVNEYGQTYLCAYYTAQKPIAAGALQAALAKTLVSYMIPAFFVRMDALPSNSNGKLDRGALTPPDASMYKAAYVAPENDAQRLLCEGFERVLKVKRIGIDDDFFALGGDSIKTVFLAEYCSALNLSSLDVLTGKTPRGIALRMADAAASASFDGLDEKAATAPLTDSQMGVYLECAQAPESTMYNIPVYYRFPADAVNAEKLLEALNTVAATYAAFSITISDSDGAPCMARRAPQKPDVPVMDADEKDVPDLRRAFVRPFALTNELLYRFELIRTRASVYLLCDFHHLIADGASIGVFERALAAAYAGEALPAEQVNLFMLSQMEKRDADGEHLRASMAYFQNKLSGLDVDSNLPADFAGAKDDGQGQKCVVTLPLSVSSVEQFTRSVGITEGTLFLGAFAYALAKYTGQEESLFCTVNSGRHDARLRDCVGMLVRTLPVYAKIDEAQSAIDYLQTVQQDFFDMMRHDDASFGALARSLGLRSDVMFVYQAQTLNGFSLGGVPAAMEVIETGYAQSNLSAMVLKREDGYELSMEYRSALYDADTIRRFAEGYGAIVAGLFSCDRLGEIAFASPADLAAIAGFNATERPVDKALSMVDLLREQARKTPDNVAIVYQNKSYTYHEYDEATENLARRIRQMGVGRGDVVSILLPRCELMPIAAIGALKAGAAYQPLDPTYPPERLNFMVKDSAAKLLIADRGLAGMLNEYADATLYTDELFAPVNDDAPLDKPCGEDAFILLYTSGTTGTPKGCVLEHRNLVNFCRWYTRHFELDESSRVAAYASFGFDANMMDTYPTLISGATLHILSEDIRLDFDAIDRYFADNGITHSFMTTQVGRQFASVTKCPSLRYLSVGGEKLTPLTPPEHIAFSNLYGPTEGTVLVSSYRVVDDSARLPIGRPVDNTRFYVADKQGRILPIGVPGELLIAGAQVARGYLNRPEQTAKAFIQNPYEKSAEYARMYRTGDIVRWLADGNIEFVGRRDGQVKIRGFRVELTEVERVIRDFPGIKDATVVAKDAAAGGKMLAAYIVSDEKMDVKALNAFILDRKPPYMVPAATMQLERIPLNVNGKVDRRKLPEPTFESEENASGPRALTALEQELFAVMKEVLGHDEFTVDTDLQLAGLTSISAIKLASALRQAFGFSPNVKELLHGASVLSVENALIAQLRVHQQEKMPEIRKRKERYPLTQTQLGVYLECRMDETSDKYNIPMMFRLDRDTDLDRLERAIYSAVEAHPFMKCKILPDAECGAVMVPQDELEWKIERRETSEADWEHALRTEQITFRFDRPPLFAIRLVRTEQSAYLWMAFHHVLMDGDSIGVLMRDIEKAFGGGALTKESYTSFDLAEDEAAARQSQAYADAKAYYDGMFAGVSVRSLPDGDALDEPEGACVLRQPLSGVEKQTVEDFCAAHRVTPNALFTAGFAYTLGKFTGNDEALFASIYNGRTDPRTFDILGMLVKTYPIYVPLAEDTLVADFVQDVKERIGGLTGNDLFSFAEASHAYDISADILFAYQGDEMSGFTVAGRQAEMAPLALNDAKASLNAGVLLDSGAYRIDLEYSASLYTKAYMERFAGLYTMVMRGLLCAETLGSIELTTPADLAAIAGFNATERPVDKALSMVDLLREQARKTPDNVAIVYQNKSYTYREYDAATENLARRIRQMGVRRGDVVSILLPRCELMPIAAIGALKAGAAYQPLDPTYPPERLNFMVKDSAAKLLIADRSLVGMLNEYAGATLYTDELFAPVNDDAPLDKPCGEDAFILLYTSGTTGTPKGCVLEHYNLVSFCLWNIRHFELDESCRVASYASFGFDANMMDTYPTLISGATLHILSEDIRLDLDEIDRYFTDNGITHSFMTTQVGRQFATVTKCPSLRHLSVGGEKLTPLMPPERLTLTNIYGPTECTVMVTCFHVLDDSARLPIGRPTDNTHLYVVDKQGRILPIGVPGELLIAGAQVARGYLNRPEQTAKAFIQNPYEENADYARMYRTGDIVRWLADGNIEFVGRRDGQVKIRGFRVELTEVERVIRDFPGIKDATIVAKDTATGEKMLAAYIVSDEKVDVKALNAFILDRKPPYMVPAATMQLERIPLNVNSKVDRRKLPEPTFSDGENTSGPRALTRLEQALFAVMKEVLGHDEFSVDTDLQLAGLTSISAIKLASALRQAFGFSPNVKELLHGASVLSVEDALVTQILAWYQQKTSDTRLRKERYPLTQTQLGVYLECRMDETSDKYNIPMMFRLDRDTDLDRLERAIYSAVEAHPFMKCKILPDAECGAVMVPQDELEWKIERRETSEADWEHALRTEQITFRFDRPPLFAIRLVRTEQSAYLWMAFHHVLMDGDSVGVLMRDIEKAFGGGALTKESYTSFDLAEDEAAARQSQAYADAKAYYDGMFAGVSVRSLPDGDALDEPESACVLRQPLSGVEKQTVEDFCAAHRVTPNALFTAGFAYTLGKLTGNDEALFASIYNGRTDPRTFDILGMLVKTYPIYVPLAEDTLVADFVQDVKERIGGLTGNDLFSFAEASRAYDISADILFAYQGDEMGDFTVAGRQAEAVPLALNGAKAPLSADVLFEHGEFALNLEYSASLYTKAYMECFAELYTMVMRGLLCAETLGDIELASADAQAFLDEINATEWHVTQRPAHCLLEESATKWPERVAVIAANEKLSYAELNARANRLAHGLIARGVRPGDIVALMLPRDARVYIARQGILKAGGAFLPIAPEYPDERVAFMLADSGAKRLIVTRELEKTRAALLSSLPCPADTVDALMDTTDESNPDIPVAADDPAYCIYTSGSTGKPKGVLLTQHNLVNFVDANPKNHEILGYTERARVSLALAAITFDVSVMEEFIPLSHGMTLCMAGEEEIHNPLALAKLMRENSVDMVSCTPSFLSNIIDLSVMREPLSRVVSYDFGAEAFPPSLYGKIREVRPDAYIMNGYGPTEATISCTMAEVTDPRRITIGRPAANVKAYIVDARGRLLPPGVCGELVICGDGVGRGYIGRDELTREKFIQFKGLRAYKTGDLAEYTAQGMLKFNGRTDNQVKLRGLRVELGEIENAINVYPGVLTSIVKVCGTEDNAFLAAYYTASQPIDPRTIQAEVSKRLTQYMVPSVLMQLDAMPLTANGKIDKKRLPEPDFQIEKQAYIAPADEIERDFCDLFAQILKLPRVSATDDFFELGGTSLSASRVAIFALERGYAIVYGDVFKATTPRALSKLARGNDRKAPCKQTDGVKDYEYEALTPYLSGNVPEGLDEIRRMRAGNILLTGATGFLGIHVLKRFLDSESGTAYCLLRAGHASSLEKRLKSMLAYYFDDSFDSYFAQGRVRCVEGDITNSESLAQLEALPFDTLLNCAASVKHFAVDDVLEHVNVHGVENLIALCKRANRRLIQVSTVSVAGESVDGKPVAETQLHENELYFGQTLDNAYVLSKFKAERAVLDAIKDGLDAKIMRVGNLMGRHSDGEFQINFRSSGFMRQLRGYKLIGAFPMSQMNAPIEFSEIDATADAILRLAYTESRFTVFHPYNNHQLTLADVVYAMREYGFLMDVVAEAEFKRRLNEAMADPSRAEAVGGVIAYLSSDAPESRVMLDASCAFTTEALYRLDFKWPITSAEYLRKSIKALDGLGMFDARQAQ